MTMIVNTPFIYDRNCIRIYEEITNNAITIDGIDYLLILSAQDTRIAKVPILMYSLYIKHKII